MLFLLVGCGQPLQLPTPTVFSSPTSDAVESTVPSGTSSGEVTATSLVSETTVLTPTVTLQTTVGPVAVDGTPVVVVVPTGLPDSAQGAWEKQQANRREFDGQKQYRANAPVALLWYDPATGQILEIGKLVGEFVATAQFELVPQNHAPTLAVPYKIDTDYGLTAISPAVKARMQAAGYNDQVEAFVVLNEAVVPLEGTQ